jgi:hypothetical protein
MGHLLPSRSGICGAEYRPVSEAGVQRAWCLRVLAQSIGECEQAFEDRLPLFIT